MQSASLAWTFALVAALGCGSPSPDDAGATPDAGVEPLVDAGVDPPDAAGTDAAVPDAGALDAGPLPTLETTVTAENTGPSGEIAVTVPITDQRSFMVVAANETAARLSVLDVTAPDGTTLVRWQDWYNEPRGLTHAFFAHRNAAVINWPIREEDPPLVPGDYVVRLGSYRVDGETSRPDVPIEVTTIRSRDHDLATGRIPVLIVWAAGLDADTALRTATEAAVAHWDEVWAGAGMGLDVRYVSSTIDPTLPYPSAMAGDLFLEASRLAMPGEVTVIIGDTIDDVAMQYGVAGRLPGPIVATEISAIVIGWLANAGGDGVFSDNDIQLYGEVLAHEVGHYVGLFHPVENAYDGWDALADTPECSGARMCESMLGTNLMFPYSICPGGVCVSTTGITDDQRGVMHRYTGAL